LGIDEIANRFSFCQLQTAISDGTKRELSRLGKASLGFHEDVNDKAQQDWRAMAMQLNEIFSCKRVRRFEVADKGLVQRLTRRWVDQTAQGEQIRLWIERFRRYESPQNVE